MPIYEFECQKCHKKLTRFVNRISKRVVMPACKCGRLMKKIISLSSFQFRGTGFYTTDYKNKEKK